jgi:hypothetical protein
MALSSPTQRMAARRRQQVALDEIDGEMSLFFVRRCTLETEDLNEKFDFACSRAALRVGNLKAQQVFSPAGPLDRSSAAA